MFVLFSLMVIITELLLRRRTSWRQHTKSLVLAISWISICWSSFPVRILIVPILHEWKFLFSIKFVDLKIIRPRFKNLRVYAVNTSPQDRCAIVHPRWICFLHVHPRWICFLLQIEGLAVNHWHRHLLLLYCFSVSLRYLIVAFMSYWMLLYVE